MDENRPGIEQPDDQGTAGAPDSDATTAAGPPRLRRSTGDRVLLGVAGGLGRYFDIDPTIFRIGFGVSIFFGGLGLLAYVLLALFVPTDGDPDTTERFGGRLRQIGFWRAIGVVALAMLALAGLFVLAGGAAFAVAIGWGVPVAIGIVAIGALLAVAAFRGGARWLILPAVALTVGAGAAAASDLDFRGGVGERSYRPLTAAAIPSDGYRLGVGRLVVDLRDLDWGPRRVVRLDVKVGAGQASVFVPGRVCIGGSTHVGAGESEVAGERNSGFDVVTDLRPPARTTPRLVLDGEVQMGQLRVINSDTADVDSYEARPDRFRQDAAGQRAAQARSCEA